MTFGLLKSIIENNLLESYKDQKDFKKAINEFKINVLNNKNLSKIYSIYDDLSNPQGLDRKDAEDFLNEGIFILRSLLPNVKLPKNIIETKVENKYKELDNLVYAEFSTGSLKERVESKKTIVETLTKKSLQSEQKINLPISTMVRIANQTLKNYVSNLDENSKKEFFELIKEDTKTLEDKFDTLKKTAIEKLSPMVDKESDEATKGKIHETIEKIKQDSFDQINYLRLKHLVESL